LPNDEDDSEEALGNDHEDSDDGDDEEDSEGDENDQEPVGDEEDETPSPLPHNGDVVPFWFAHEDQDQINEIVQIYNQTLNIERERKMCLRAPVPFVGSIKRTQVHNTLFSTLDEVSVYLRDIKPLGVDLPLSRTVWLLTSWEVSEGIPLHSFEIREDRLREFWQKRSRGASSFLYCRPVFHTKGKWSYGVCDQDVPVTYADSIIHTHTPCYTPYIPKQHLHSGEPSEN